MDKFSFPLKKLWFTHIVILVVSNYAVQIPLDLFGIVTTVGTFTYPFVFLSTDLTVRIFGKIRARKIVFLATIPGLIVSYLIGTLFEHGDFQGLTNLSHFSYFVFRITIASLSAYLLGQLCDILVFQRLRELKLWWPAPVSSSILGNMIDTYVFFAIAFCGTNDAFMAEHWVEIATFDYMVKLAANMLIFVPVYGVVLKYIIKKITAA